MNLREYQTASRATAIYPRDRALEYCVLGLISEVGELAGKLKKSIRDGTPEDVLREQILDELGDCLWYCAQIATEKDAKILAGPPASTGLRSLVAPRIATLGSLSGVLGCNIAHWSSLTIAGELPRLVHQIAYIATAFGSSLESVLDRNIAKLASRQRRGVLQGEGDGR